MIVLVLWTKIEVNNRTWARWLGLSWVPSPALLAVFCAYPVGKSHRADIIPSGSRWRPDGLLCIGYMAAENSCTDLFLYLWSVTAEAYSHVLWFATSTPSLLVDTFLLLQCHGAPTIQETWMQSGVSKRHWSSRALATTGAHKDLCLLYLDCEGVEKKEII